MERDFWDQRYAEQGHAYGLNPNAFLVSQRTRFQPDQSVLVIGEGEGRNGVWLAEQGLHVVAVDQSRVGLQKAEELARQRGVEIETHCADLRHWQWPQDRFDFAVSIFVHFPPDCRETIHQACLASLKPGGYLIMQAFTPEQLDYSSGGPPVKEMLFSEKMIRSDFAASEIELLETGVCELAEGKYHCGEGAVLNLIARKK